MLDSDGPSRKKLMFHIPTYPNFLQPRLSVCKLDEKTKQNILCFTPMPPTTVQIFGLGNAARNSRHGSHVSRSSSKLSLRHSATTTCLPLGQYINTLHDTSLGKQSYATAPLNQQSLNTRHTRWREAVRHVRLAWIAARYCPYLLPNMFLLPPAPVAHPRHPVLTSSTTVPGARYCFGTCQYVPKHTKTHLTQTRDSMRTRKLPDPGDKNNNN